MSDRDKNIFNALSVLTHLCSQTTEKAGGPANSRRFVEETFCGPSDGFTAQTFTNQGL